MTQTTAKRHYSCDGCGAGIAVGQPLFRQKTGNFCSRHCIVDSLAMDSKLSRTARILDFMAEEQGGMREAINAIP